MPPAKACPRLDQGMTSSKNKPAADFRAVQWVNIKGGWYNTNRP